MPVIAKAEGRGTPIAVTTLLTTPYLPEPMPQLKKNLHGDAGLQEVSNADCSRCLKTPGYPLRPDAELALRNPTSTRSLQGAGHQPLTTSAGTTRDHNAPARAANMNCRQITHVSNPKLNSYV